jgi:uncharacterized protein (DUF2147 family)
MIARIGAAWVLLAALGSVATGAAAGVTGLWKTPIDGGSLIRLAPCGDALCGWVVTSPRLRANPEQRDVRNRDQSLRGRRLGGLLVLKVRPLADTKWGDGWAYNPEDGGVYTGTLELRPEGTLGVTGCVVVPLCKTEIWTRAQ